MFSSLRDSGSTAFITESCFSFASTSVHQRHVLRHLFPIHTLLWHEFPPFRFFVNRSNQDNTRGKKGCQTGGVGGENENPCSDTVCIRLSTPGRNIV